MILISKAALQGRLCQDLLTIRANRHHYYFGADELFARHPDIVQRLIRTARSLLPKLLDGLVWRSRFAVDGQRRVNLAVLVRGVT